MKKNLFLASMVGAMLAIILFFLPRASSQSPDPQLRLHRGTFDAQQPGLYAATGASRQAAPGPYTIIQFRGPVTPADRAMLKQTGVTILEYLPDYAFLVQGSESQLATAEDLHRTYARVPFTLADKLAPSLLRAIQRSQKDMGRLQIVSWPGREDDLARDLNSLSFDVEGELKVDQLMQVANLASVRWIEPLGLTRRRVRGDPGRGGGSRSPPRARRPVRGSLPPGSGRCRGSA